MIRVLKVISIVLAVSLQPAAGIVNKKRNSSSLYPPHFYPRREYFKRKSYLETNRPLWVLEDKVTHDETEIATHKPFKGKRRFISSATLPPKLPSHYVNLEPIAVGKPTTQSMPRNHKRTQSHHSFPVFDDFEVDAEPILIYRGPKAEMIFNTMMTSRQYPMKEPVPGQVMYPPYSPKFKPTPVVQRQKFPESVFHNVTLIPFYAHEAIDPSQPHYDQTTPSDAIDELEDNEIESQKYLTDEEDYEEPPCYHSYYSQDDVQAKYWSLPYTTAPPPPAANTPMTLNRQVGVPNGLYSNHRMEATTQMPPPPPPPPESPFRIMVDETPPLKRYKTVHTAKYGGFKTIYPIYTLNKLLKYKPQYKSQKTLRRTVDIPQRKPPPPEETWLIWNSRHKTTHTPSYLSPRANTIVPKKHQTSAELDTKILVQ